MTLAAPRTLERLISKVLQGVPGLLTLELEPVKGGEDTPELQARKAITFSFASTRQDQPIDTGWYPGDTLLRCRS